MDVDLSLLELASYGVISFVTSILGGMAGGGAGFVNVPLLIFFGLSPAQAVATGKLAGLSGAVSSLAGLRKVDHQRSKKQIVIIVGMALLIGLFAPLVITNLDSTIYRRILGVVLLIMIPVLVFKKLGHTTWHPGKRHRTVGYALLIPAFTIQGIFGSGMGTFVNIILMGGLGMSALESNIVKRYSQIVLNVVIVLGILASGLIVWQAAAVGIIASFGGYIGGRIAVRRGNKLVLGVMVSLAFLSAIFLLLG